MACTKEYIDFVCSQLEGVGEIRTRKMCGDWCIYIDNKLVILVCDNLCYVKMHPSIEPMMKGAWTSYPYKGAKEHYVLGIENKEQALSVIKKLIKEMPTPKCKTSKAA